MIYQRLGGQATVPEFRLGAWDLEYEGVAVELDEQLHFNRYRSITLQSELYKQHRKFALQEYQLFCASFENHCLRAGCFGGKWSNKSSVSQFGPAGQPGNLLGDGSPRWRQRAFYDFLKDLSPLLIGVDVVRISIWNLVTEGGVVRTVGDVLRAPGQRAADAVAELIRDRMSSLNLRLRAPLRT